MKSEIIIHNSVSIDGSLTGFMPDMGLHYQIAGSYKPDAHLIGSETIIKGIDPLLSASTKNLASIKY